MENIINERKEKYKARVHICSNIRLLRILHGQTQREVAEQLNMALTTYGHMECGMIMPGLNTLHAISKYYDIDMDYLVSFDLTRHILDMIKHKPDVPSAMNFVLLYSRLSSGGRFQINEKIAQCKSSEQNFNLFPWNYDD